MTAQLPLDEVLGRFFHNDPEILADPYPLYRRLLAEAPIFPYAPGRYFFCRYADASSILRDPRLSADLSKSTVTDWYDALPEPERSDVQRQVQLTQTNIVRMDPPAHTRLRGLMLKAFTPRVVASMRSGIQEIVDGLLDEAQERGQLDLIADFAFPLPATVIADLLGIPPADLPLLKQWSNDWAAYQTAGHTVDEMKALLTSRMTMFAYIRDLARERREKPGDDLLSGFVTVKEGGEGLSEQDIISSSAFLLFAGHETTTNLIGNGMLALFRHPDQLRALRGNPSLVASAIDELLRYDAPVQYTVRMVTEEMEIGRFVVRPGERVQAMIGAANHDPQRFPEPGRLDLTRRDNRHLSFGFGIHYCLGAALARLEGEIAFTTLLGRFPRLSLACERVEWRPSSAFRGLAQLHVALD